MPNPLSIVFDTGVTAHMWGSRTGMSSYLPALTLVGLEASLSMHMVVALQLSNWTPAFNTHMESTLHSRRYYMCLV